MAQIGKISEQVQLKCSGVKFYELWKNKMDCIFQMFPQIFKSYAIVEGNGIAHGTVIHLKYDMGGPGELKERLSMDDANKVISIDVVEGDVLNDFEMFKLKIQVLDNGSNGSSVNWSIEFVKANEDVVPPYKYFPFTGNVTKALDDYLCNN